MELKRKIIQFDSKKLTYLDNEGTGKIIFVTHANGYSGSCYLYLYRSLNPDYRWIFLDFLGHGESEFSLNFQNWNYFRDQVLTVLQKENLTNVLGVGHSLGGASLSLASKIEPHRFQNLLLLDPTILSSFLLILGKVVGNHMAKTAIKRRRDFSGKEQVRKIFRRFPIFSNWREDIYEDYVQTCFRSTDKGVSLCCPPEMESRIFDSVPILFPRNYKNLPIKTRVIIPEKSDVCSKRAALRLIGDLPGSSVRILHNENHFFPFEKPEIVINELRDLING